LELDVWVAHAAEQKIMSGEYSETTTCRLTSTERVCGWLGNHFHEKIFYRSLHLRGRVNMDRSRVVDNINLRPYATGFPFRK
jgi:hypothetical protein